ncbi:MAG: hypothetical protein GF418_16000 [Chitinivibrionales bacterium]|nr:hypothetical protein [Chitinivibrionales bacterium]
MNMHEEKPAADVAISKAKEYVERSFPQQAARMADALTRINASEQITRQDVHDVISAQTALWSAAAKWFVDMIAYTVTWVSESRVPVEKRRSEAELHGFAWAIAEKMVGTERIPGLDSDPERGDIAGPISRVAAYVDSTKDLHLPLHTEQSRESASEQPAQTLRDEGGPQHEEAEERRRAMAHLEKVDPDTYLHWVQAVTGYGPILERVANSARQIRTTPDSVLNLLELLIGCMHIAAREGARTMMNGAILTLQEVAGSDDSYPALLTKDGYAEWVRKMEEGIETYVAAGSDPNGTTHENSPAKQHCIYCLDLIGLILDPKYRSGYAETANRWKDENAHAYQEEVERLVREAGMRLPEDPDATHDEDETPQ